MLTLTAQLTKSAPSLFGADLDTRLKWLADAEQKISQSSAATATRITQSRFKYRRDIIAPRPGRDSTGGRMSTYLRWEATADGVVFDRVYADAHAPHWIIQEIGTGAHAVMRSGGDTLPQGRPAAGADYIADVPAQTGRYIKGGLVFASNGQYTPTQAGIGNEQIYRASSVNAPRGVPKIRIGHEIKGQHMVQAGGEAGFQQYQTKLLLAARRAFKK